MTVTYTSAAERDTLRTRLRARTFGVSDLLMWATSCVALFAISLAYTGRLRVFEASEMQHAGLRIVNLNTVTDAAEIEPAVGAIFANAADRRFAARELLRFVETDRNAGRAQSNVGGITRATVRLDAIGNEQRLEVFARRAQTTRETVRTSVDNRSETMPLFTASDLVAVKPFFVVRTRGAFRYRLLWFGGLYLLGFQLIALVWRLRGTRGDRVLLAAAHLLTVVGFAVLLSRVDPLRDNLLFVRYAEGVLVGLLLIMALSLVDFGTATFLELSYLPLIVALSLSVLLILFGTGPGRSGAKVNLGPVQPIEAIRLLLALFLAGFFARRWELLRDLRGGAIRTLKVPAWLDVPRGEYVLPVHLPIGIDPQGHLVLLYLVTAVVNDDFSAFLQRHADLLRVVPTWTLRGLLFFKTVGESGAAFRQAVRNELASPLSTAEIAELEWYFGQVREAAIRRTWLPSDGRFRHVHEAFETTRYRILYRRWLSDGDAALEVVSSGVIKAAMERGAGCVECVSVPHSYRHLSPLASLVRRSSQPTVSHDRLPSAGDEKGEPRGEQALARPQPPPPATLTIAEELARDWYRLIGRS